MDHELEQLEVVVNVLVALSPMQRRRAMAYLLDRFANDLPAQGGTGVFAK
jgi:hypothetical protein